MKIATEMKLVKLGVRVGSYQSMVLASWSCCNTVMGVPTTVQYSTQYSIDWQGVCVCVRVQFEQYLRHS